MAGKTKGTAALKTTGKPSKTAQHHRKGAKGAKAVGKGSSTTSADKTNGRPSAFTDETKTKILTAIAAGNTLRTSAEYGGITYETLRAWLRKGDVGEEKFSVFSAALKKAQADAEALSVGRIRQAAKGGAIIERTTITTERTSKSGMATTTTRTTERYSPPQWQADAWWLERTRDEWRRHDKVTRTNFNFDLENLTDEQFELFDQLTNNDVDPAIAYATALNLGKKEGAGETPTA